MVSKMGRSLVGMSLMCALTKESQSHIRVPYVYPYVVHMWIIINGFIHIHYPYPLEMPHHIHIHIQTR